MAEEEEDQITPETFIELYSNMRTGTDVNETDQALYEIYGNEKSIPVLFQIIQNSDDLILSQYAIYGVIGCLRKIGNKLSVANLNLTRKLTLQILQSASDTSIINAAINIISELLRHWKEWNDLKLDGIHILNKSFLSLLKFNICITSLINIRSYFI